MIQQKRMWDIVESLSCSMWTICGMKFMHLLPGWDETARSSGEDEDVAEATQAGSRGGSPGKMGWFHRDNGLFMEDFPTNLFLFGTWILFSPIAGMMIQSDELIFGQPPTRFLLLQAWFRDTWWKHSLSFFVCLAVWFYSMFIPRTCGCGLGSLWRCWAVMAQHISPWDPEASLWRVAYEEWFLFAIVI